MASLCRQYASVRYVDHNWKIRQVMAQLAVPSKSLSGYQLAAELNDVISTTLQVRKHQIMAIMRDGASVNGAAMRVFSALYPSFIDITCFARTIDRVGVYFELSTLDQFMNWWVQLFARIFCSQAWLEATQWFQYENILANKVVEQVGANAVCYDPLC